jgi:hypothetical protein
VSFKKNKYLVVRNAISKELATFVNQYIFLKRHVITNLYMNDVLRETTFHGTWNDTQVPGHFSCYSDYGGETILNNLKPLIEKNINLKILPTYSYLRVYTNGAYLEQHKDRPSCEISGTLNISGDMWPIYMVKNKKKFYVELFPGDLLLYKGAEIEHGRDEFKGNYCTQLFLHYVEKNKKYKNYIYDKRKYLGFPRFIEIKKYRDLT